MKQNPSSIKFKKNQKPSNSLLFLSEQKNFILIKGQMGLKSLENGKLTYKQIEACRKSIKRVLKKQGLIFIRVFTNVSITKKAFGSRMGKGKGSHSFWVCPIKKGQIVCEVKYYFTTTINIVFNALKSGGTKLPVLTNVIYNKY